MWLSLAVLLILPVLYAAREGHALAQETQSQETQSPETLPLIAADNKNIHYVGRVDFSDPKLPRFWSPGVYVQAKFRGPSCAVVLNDEVLYGNSHNFVEIAVDHRKPFRVQTTGKTNTILAASGLPAGVHTITVCKDTEAGIGSLEFVGFRCAGLVPSTLPKRKLEFIGDSITCGASSDLSIPCGKGQWYEQHNAYLSYGPTAARTLNAQWHQTSVSGIGLMHSCCDMKTTMPDVFGKLNLNNGTQPWDFRRYQPDAVTICLGQNDGEQDPAAFQANYLKFIQQVRAAYPKARIICLSSPMGNADLTAYLKTNLTQVAEKMHALGDKNVSTFFFSRSYNGGCGGHPDVAEHQLIAAELTADLHTALHW